MRWVPTKSRTVQNALPFDSAQPTAELLEEQRRALGGAQHQDGVDGGHVDALVEQVDGEHDADSPVGEVAQRGLALGPAGCRPTRRRRRCRAG